MLWHFWYNYEEKIKAWIRKNRNEIKEVIRRKRQIFPWVFKIKVDIGDAPVLYTWWFAGKDEEGIIEPQV